MIRNTKRCPVTPGSQENSVIGQNVETCKEGKVVANRVFLISSIGDFT
jgi:hypothetical protein